MVCKLSCSANLLALALLLSACSQRDSENRAPQASSFCAKTKTQKTAFTLADDEGDKADCFKGGKIALLDRGRSCETKRDCLVTETKRAVSGGTFCLTSYGAVADNKCPSYFLLYKEKIAAIDYEFCVKACHFGEVPVLVMEGTRKGAYDCKAIKKGAKDRDTNTANIRAPSFNWLKENVLAKEVGGKALCLACHSAGARFDLSTETAFNGKSAAIRKHLKQKYPSMPPEGNTQLNQTELGFVLLYLDALEKGTVDPDVKAEEAPPPRPQTETRKTEAAIPPKPEASTSPVSTNQGTPSSDSSADPCAAK